jgi:fido (protein-threonine AMPylation protein)
MDEFEEYIKQGEPDQKEKSIIWKTAIGLQQVDNLTPSKYLFETAKSNIEGDITIEEANEIINSYYKSDITRKDTEARTEEADKVSVRIAKILSEKTFALSSIEYINIHKELFNGIYDFAGEIRDYNITKAEWVLDGDTVFYATANTLKETLEYDLQKEKKFSYKNLGKDEVVSHIARFISSLWQIHIFGEGNTRVAAVFLIKYLRKLGFKNIENKPFETNSWYFRNSLVRANYENIQKNIVAEDKFLKMFLSNVIFRREKRIKEQKNAYKIHRQCRRKKQHCRCKRKYLKSN